MMYSAAFTILLTLSTYIFVNSHQLLPINTYEGTNSGQPWKHSADPMLPDTENQRAKRVPDVLDPLDYHIRIQPYFPTIPPSIPAGKTNMTFDAIVTFIFRVKAATTNFTMHSVNLTYDVTSGVQVRDEDEKLIDSTFTLVPDMEQIVIKPVAVPEVGKVYLITFKYSGPINPFEKGGIFYTSYVDESNTMHFMIASHLEAFLARTVFPCLDEPSYKAIFHLTMVYPSGYVALGNMMERSSTKMLTPLDSWSVVQFPPTLKMSTYLVAFAVGPFVSDQAQTQDGTLVRIWGWTGQEPYLKYAAEISSKCLYAMGQYTNFKFPMSKSDQLGLPEFIGGAMENYGLIIYDYVFIAFNAAVHSTYFKEAAAKTMCHELSHQWFGNTVTAAWWDDVFLQEGMAAFFENFSLRKAIPEQLPFLEGKFLAEIYQSGLNNDAIVNSSHTLYYYDGPAFDAITYNKGASVVRMIEQTFDYATQPGATPAFQDAMQQYIANHKFGNADHQAFFDELTAAASRSHMTDWCGNSLNATLFLEPYFLQQSFPLLTVRNDQILAGAVTEQQPYNDISTLPTTNYSQAHNYSWPVPFFSKNYRNKSRTLRWLTPGYESCNKDGPHPNSKALHWELGDSEQGAFVRVQYDDTGFARLLNQLKAKANDSTTFTISDHIMLIGDHIALLKRDQDLGKPFSYKRLLQIISLVIPNQPHFGSFEVAERVIDQLEPMFVAGPDYGLFQRFINYLLNDNYANLGWNVTGDWDRDVSRYLMFPYVVRYGIGDSQDQAKARFQDLLKNCSGVTTSLADCNLVHPDFRRTVYCGGIMTGSEADFDKLLQFYKQEKQNNAYFYQEYYTMLRGLACTTSQTSMNKLLPELLVTFALKGDYDYQATEPLNYLITNPKASDWMAQFLVQNSTLVLSSGKLVDYLRAMTGNWYSRKRIAQFANLFGQLNASLSDDQKANFAAAYQAVIQQADFADKYLPDIIRILYDIAIPDPSDLGTWDPAIPSDLKPSTYDVDVRPYIPGAAKYPWYKNLTHEGTVTMNFTAQRLTDRVILGAHRMIIYPEDVLLTYDGGSAVATEATKNYDKGLVTLKFGNIFLKKNHNFTLSIKYTGFIFDVGREGVYTNTNFYEFDDQKAWIFATYLETGPGTRTLVPCFDEPIFKALWKMSVSHPADMTALGNMIEDGTTILADGWAKTSFVRSPLMPSYLLTLAAGHFASLQTLSATGVLVRTWAWTGMERYAEPALKSVAGAVDFMSQYFDFQFPLQKLDALALPQYTAATGAEEHWGMIHVMYDRELMDPLYTVTPTAIDVVRVVAHETAHQWFGDLVTLIQWKDAFLNEGFANYWETWAVNYTFPEQSKYAPLEFFRKAEAAFGTDSSVDTSIPIIGDALNHFGGITYNKGAAMLDMLSNAISPQLLQAGLRNYIKTNAFGNAYEDTLWSSITQAVSSLSGWNGNALNISELMAPWMHQATYPVLKLERNATTVTYSQEPYITNTSLLGPSDYNYMWTIPIQSQDQYGSYFTYFHGKNGDNDYWTRAATDEWHLDNVGRRSFVRVWYDDQSWQLIINQMNKNFKRFDEITRAQLISDAAALQKRGSVPWTRLLDLSMFLQHEDSYAPFDAFKPTFDKLLIAFKSESTHFANMQRYLNSLIQESYTNNGWNSTGEWTHDLLSAFVTEYACKLDNADCKAKASTAFLEFVQYCGQYNTSTGNCNRMKPDMRKMQYCYGLKQNANQLPLVRRLYDYTAANSKYFNRDTDNLLYALTCVDTQDNLNSILTDIFNGVLPPKAFAYVAEHSTDSAMLDYLTANASAVFGAAEFSDYLSAAAATYYTDAQLAKLNGLKSLPTLSEDDKASIDAAAQTVQNNKNWFDANSQDIIDWISQRHFARV